MCIIIHAMDKEVLDNESLLQCSEYHEDGVGVMFYHHDGSLIVNKSHKSKDYKSILATVPPQTEFGMHFRWKTHGPVNKKNTHPFKLSKTTAFMHNGMISGYGTHKKSDTRDFADQLRVCEMFEDDVTLVDYLEYEARSYNKFLLAKGGKFQRYGTWDTIDVHAAFSSDPFPLANYSRYGANRMAFTTRGSQDYWQEDWDGDSGVEVAFTMPWKRKGMSAEVWCKNYPELAAMLIEEIESTHFIDSDLMEGFDDYVRYWDKNEQDAVREIQTRQ